MRDRLTPAQGIVQIINVKMDDIELRSALEHTFQHQNLVRQSVHAVLVQTQRAPAPRHQPSFRHRVATGKERHVVTLTNQFLSEVRHNPFRPSI